ncbi:hypothetical protein [Spiroplasma endosymbiont of Virgichneumon dumeticola]|uniref:hypothetical protein n=1 Tax=Spiroplasma endosymbiont of Virgichneumon dumeticola TaxID=3139323 RepID=UPI0035C90AA1
MAIKDPILFITVEEFKNYKYFNELLFDKVTTPDNEIWFAISVASSNIDYLSGFTISKKWPEITPTDFTDNIQTATTNYVRFLLTKDIDYLRGQGSISQGGLTYSETNEIEDNCWDIELKDNPTPNPNPSVPEWKEVAVSTDLVTINYNLKNKNYYRVFYNGRTRDLITNIGKGTHEIKEFYYQDNENAFMLGIFNMMLTGMPMYIKNNGVSLYAESRMCNLWKLEELQE